MKKDKRLTIGSILIFAVGLLVGLWFLIGASWADYEASLFDTANGAEGILWSIHCPVMISPYEKGVVSATIHNDAPREKIRRVQTHISAGYVSYMKESLETLKMAPDEKQTLQWEFSADDAAWDILVLARVTLFSNYPSPSLTGSCGIQVVNILGLPGRAISLAACLLSLGLMAAGAGWYKQAKTSLPAQRDQPYGLMAAFASLVVTGMLAVLAGLWLLSSLTVLVILLLALVTLTSIALKSIR